MESLTSGKGSPDITIDGTPLSRKGSDYFRNGMVRLARVGLVDFSADQAPCDITATAKGLDVLG